MAFKFHRGDYVIDKITGFKGMVTAREDHITRCNKYCVEPASLTKEGELTKGYWFDELQLILDTTKGRFILEASEDSPPG